LEVPKGIVGVEFSENVNSPEADVVAEGATALECDSSMSVTVTPGTGFASMMTIPLISKGELVNLVNGEADGVADHVHLLVINFISLLHVVLGA